MGNQARVTQSPAAGSGGWRRKLSGIKGATPFAALKQSQLEDAWCVARDATRATADRIEHLLSAIKADLPRSKQRVISTLRSAIADATEFAAHSAELSSAALSRKEYLSRLPASIARGKVLVHNHIRPTTRHLGMRGFRAWLQAPDRDRLAVCKCGFAPELGRHFCVRALMAPRADAGATTSPMTDATGRAAAANRAVSRG